MWFLSIWQFSTGSVFINLFGLLRLLLISQENVDVSEFNCTPHQQNSGQIIKLFIGRMLHIPLNGCLERVNAIFCRIKSCFCDGEKKKTEKKKEPGQHCTVWNFQRDFAFTVCSMKVRFHFSHERSISKYCSCYNRLLISQWSRSFRDLGYKISRLSDKCGLNIVIINFRMKTTLKILFFSFFLWKTSFSSSFYIHSSYTLYVDIRCCQPFA